MEQKSGSEFVSNRNIRVEFEDCDAMGVVYHPNYLRYIERGRIEFLRDHGIPYSSFLETGSGLVVAEVHAQYLRPARFEDEIYLYSRQIAYDEKRVILEQFIVREPLSKEQELLPMDKIKGRVFTCTLHMVSVNMTTLRSAPLPETIAAKLRLLTIPQNL